MKIGITGHTKGLGHALFNLFKLQGHEVVGFSRSNGYDIVEKKDDVINAVKDFDMFINNAYAPIAQTELLSRMITEWQGTDKTIVNISSKVVIMDEPPAMVKDYANNKLIQNLLSDDWSILLHCDWRLNSALRLVLDEIFGEKNFVNEIVWCYQDIGSRQTNYFKKKHDNILFYQKSDKRNFNVLRQAMSESTIKRFEKYFDQDGKITYQKLKDTNPGVFKKLKN